MVNVFLYKLNYKNEEFFILKNKDGNFISWIGAIFSIDPKYDLFDPQNLSRIAKFNLEYLAHEFANHNGMKISEAIQYCSDHEFNSIDNIETNVNISYCTKCPAVLVEQFNSCGDNDPIVTLVAAQKI